MLPYTYDYHAKYKVPGPGSYPRALYPDRAGGIQAGPKLLKPLRPPVALCYAVPMEEAMEIKIGKFGGRKRSLAKVLVDEREVGRFVRQADRRGRTMGYYYDLTVYGRRVIRTIDVEDQGGGWAEARRDLELAMRSDVKIAAADREHGTRTCVGCGAADHSPFSCEVYAALVSRRGEQATREQIQGVLASSGLAK